MYAYKYKLAQNIVEDLNKTFKPTKNYTTLLSKHTQDCHKIISHFTNSSFKWAINTSIEQQKGQVSNKKRFSTCKQKQIFHSQIKSQDLCSSSTCIKRMITHSEAFNCTKVRPEMFSKLYPKSLFFPEFQMT